MDYCSEFGTGRSACVAMVYTTASKKCWLVNDTMTVDNIVPDDGENTAFVSDLSIFQNLDTSCSYANASTQKTPNNLTFEIFCNSNIGDDIKPWVAVSGSTDHHFESLHDCMQFCSMMRPKCYRVTYNAGLTDGYRNCIFKGPGATINKLLPGNLDSHTALAQFDSDFNTTCSGGNYTAPNDTTFSMTCDASADGQSISAIYAPNFGDCMNTCAAYAPPQDRAGSNCRGVLYQPDGADGYENCYLMATAQYNGTRSAWRMALRLDNVGQPVNGTSSTGNSGSGGGHHASKAWIAGPAVAAVVAVAVLLGVYLWWRKRRSHTKDMNIRQRGAGSGRKPRWWNRAELDADFTERKELETRQPTELPGSEGVRQNDQRKDMSTEPSEVPGSLR